MPKTIKRSLKKAVKTAAKRAPKHGYNPRPRAAMKTAARKREATHKIQPRKARTAMSAATTDKPVTGYNANSEENKDPQSHPNQPARPKGAVRSKDNSPRGAGSGENAIVQREKLPPREIVPAPVETTEYEKGDIDKGRLDYNALANVDVANVIPIRDRRAYLIDQAEKNEAANDEINAIQVEKNRQGALRMGIFQDPDFMRENSMETAIAALGDPDPDKQLEQIEKQKQMRAERDERLGNGTGGSPTKAGVHGPTGRSGRGKEVDAEEEEAESKSKK